MLLPSTSTQYTSPFNDSHAAQHTDSWVAYNPQCTQSQTQGDAWSAAYRPGSCQTFRDPTTFQTPASLHSPAQSHPIQIVRNNYPSHDTLAQVHSPRNGPIAIFSSNSLYQAETDSRRLDTVTSVTASRCPPGSGLGFEADHGFIGRPLSGPVYTPRLTQDNYAFQDATLTDTIESTARPQDSFEPVQPAATNAIAISLGIQGLDGFTRWKSTVLPMAHDPSLSPTSHPSHTPLPHKVTIANDSFQPTTSSGSSREHPGSDPQSGSTQHHKNMGKATHYLRRHLNSKQWVCICNEKPFSNRYNGSRHVKEFASCFKCHKKTGRKGNGTYCQRCIRALELDRER